MFKLLAVCLFAIAIAKWNQHVQATEDLDAEERRLLQQIENELEKDKRDSDQCDTDACQSDDDCRLRCCIDGCDDMNCVAECYGGQDKRTAGIQELRDDKVNPQKKILFRRIRRRSRRSRRVRLWPFG